HFGAGTPQDYNIRLINDADKQLRIWANTTGVIAKFSSTAHDFVNIPVSNFKLSNNEDANKKQIINLANATSANGAVNARNLGLLGNMTYGSKCADGQIVKYQLLNQTWICNTLQGSSGNVTVNNSGASQVWNLGSNAVTTSGAPQTIAKQMNFSSNVNIGGNITSTAPFGKTFKITAPPGVAICIGTC